ncbi:MAG TPA: urease accessory protein [Methylibium sp.]|nr:urease accessory protein [Methylibium sp.]
MITGTVLLFGLLFGMQHALEADHLAALATLVARDRGRGRVIRQGLFWGLGHTLTLLALGGAVMVVGLALSERTVHGLEAAVGVMLLLLGLDLLRRLWRERVHFHGHRHAPASEAPPVHHFHAHTHQGDSAPHDRDAHRHEHRPLPLRALLVGMVHGLAGSAALVLLTLRQVGDPWVGLLYVIVFGLGSMVGMGLLSWAVSLPLRLTGGHLTLGHRVLTVGIALASIGLGLHTMAAQWPA